MPIPPVVVDAPDIGDVAVPSIPAELDSHVGDPPPWEEWALEVDAILESPWGEHPDLEVRVQYWMLFWQTRGREHFIRYLERMGRYNHLVDLHIQERELPPSLRYLPIVESGYSPGAVSRVGATGLWQFMGPTARGMGLTVDGVMDERRDPLASTAAALDYLTELHDRFDSWFLALAAYNAGPGRVSGILARNAAGAEGGDSLFVALRTAFPAETRDFVPRLLAAARIARDPEGFGFTGVEPLPPLLFDEVEVPDAISVDVIARAAGVEEEVIQGLNPHMLRGFTPRGVASRIRVPEGGGDAFLARLREIPQNEWVSFVEHRVARGETLSHIAARYGIPVRDLQGANGSLDPRRLQIGQRIVVPVGGRGRSGTAVIADGSPGGATAEGSGQTREYQVQRGDTLSGIAARHGVSASALARFNGLSLSSVIRPGDRVRIPAGAAGG